MNCYIYSPLKIHFWGLSCVYFWFKPIRFLYRKKLFDITAGTSAGLSWGLTSNQAILTKIPYNFELQKLIKNERQILSSWKNSFKNASSLYYNYSP